VVLRRVAKYNNRKAPCSQPWKCKGLHDSVGEARYCNKLAMLERAGQLTYRTQVSFVLPINGKVIGTHIVDFMVTWNGKPEEVHEYKGAMTEGWKLKYKLFCALHPDIPYLVIGPKGLIQKGLPRLTKVKNEQSKTSKKSEVGNGKQTSASSKASKAKTKSKS